MDQLRRTCPLDGLEIIGYANVLDQTMLPSVVPPIFCRMAEPEICLLPPYLIESGAVWNFTEVSRRKVQSLALDEEVSLFEKAFPARALYDLYIDDQFQHHYEPRPVVRGRLKNIAQSRVEKAIQAFRQGNFSEALKHSGVAVSANENALEPYLIKAAICRLKADKHGELLLAELAGHIVTEGVFLDAVEALISRYSPTMLFQRTPPAQSTSPINGMANQRPRSAAA